MQARVPIRWRMTIWYAALLLVTLILLGTGIYLVLRTVLSDTFAEQVRQDAVLASAGITIGPDGLSVDPATLASFDGDERFIRVVDSTGRITVDTADAEELGAGVLPPLDVVPIRREYRTIHTDDGPYGVAIVPIMRDGRVAGAVEVGVSRSDLEQTLRLITIVFAVAIPLSLGAAMLGGYLLSGWALAPVVDITNRVAVIEADDLDTRLHLDLPDDELGRLAATFDAMLDRIGSAFDRQKQFTGDAAHELRTPLSLMRSQVDLILDRPRSSAAYQAALIGLRDDVDRLTAIVGTLLTLARADAGTLPAMRERVDLSAVVRQIVASYASQADAAGVTLVDEASPAIADVDEGLTVQLLVNVMDNALAHTPIGGTIRIGCEVRADEVCLWVADTGAGIPAEHVDRIFDRFYRVDAGRTRSQGGAGLGLALSKAIAEAHGGTLTVASTPGEGSRFEFCLPSAPPMGSIAVEARDRTNF